MSINAIESIGIRLTFPIETPTKPHKHYEKVNDSYCGELPNLFHQQRASTDGFRPGTCLCSTNAITQMIPRDFYDNAAMVYSLAYLAAFTVGFLFLAHWGWRRKFPMRDWWLVITSAFLFFIIGTQVVRWSTADWEQALRYEPLSSWPGRSVMGGVLLFVPAILLVKRVLRFRFDVADAFAYAFPVGLAIQRVGCLAAGCCYGTPTEVPWAITFGPGSEVLEHHRHLGFVPPQALCSLPVHPAQIYDLLLCLLCLVLLMRFRSQIHRPGSLLMLTLFNYGLGRFVIEFFRTGYGTPVWMSLTGIQLALAVVLPVLLFLLIRRESRSLPASVIATSESSRVRHFVVGLALAGILFFFSRWMSPLETLSIQVVLLPLLLATIVEVFYSMTIPSLRLTSVLLIFISVLMMGQTYPEYATDKDKRLNYWTISYGRNVGRSQADFGSQQSYCGPVPATSYSNDYRVDGLGLSVVRQTGPEQGMVFGANVFWGNHNEDISTNSAQLSSFRTFSQFGVSPYFQRNWRHVGIGIGFSAGNFTQLLPVNEDSRTTVRELSIYPSANFRLGSLLGPFVEYRFAQHFPSPFPGLVHQLGFGIPMGNHGGVFRMGTASSASLYLAPLITFGKNVAIEPYVGFGPGLFYTHGDGSGVMASINIQMRLGHQER